MENIVVTGMGVVSTAGNNLKTFWDSLASGTITYGVIEEFRNDKNYRIKIGAQIKDRTWERECVKNLNGNYGLASKYAVSAVDSALLDAGLTTSDLPDGRTAVCIGTTMGEIAVEETISAVRHRDGLDNVPPNLFSQYNTDLIGGATREYLKASGPTYIIPTACAAGNYAIALGMQLLDWRKADIAIVGGVDVFSRVAFVGFQRLLSLAPELCQPFDQKRKGLVLGEGCGILILEKRSNAVKRAARIYGEVSSTGLCSDSHHMTAPHPQGKGAIKAITKAIVDAKIAISDIDYVSAHGTGTNANDKVESLALKQIFGSHTVPPTSSIKSMIGHSLGAASALEAIASMLMMKYNVMLPTMNFENTDEHCIIDCVPNKKREKKLNFVLSNSFAFGGQVSAILLRKG